MPDNSGRRIVRELRRIVHGTARIVIRSLHEMGISNIVATKMTGAGYHNDIILSFLDAGANSLLDFVDVGLPSTVVPREEYRKSLHKLFGMIREKESDVLVVEAGASPCESDDGQLVLEAFGLCQPQEFVCHSRWPRMPTYAVAGAKAHFKRLGIRPNMVTGIVANTSAGRNLVLRMTGMPA